MSKPSKNIIFFGLLTTPPIIYRMQFIVHSSLHHALFHPSTATQWRGSHSWELFWHALPPSAPNWQISSYPQDRVWASSSLEGIVKAQIGPCIVLGIPKFLALITSLHQIIFYVQLSNFKPWMINSSKADTCAVHLCLPSTQCSALHAVDFYKCLLS